MKLLIIYDGSGPKYHRILAPVTLMPGVEFVVSHVITEDLVKDIDLLFFNRALHNTSINQVCEWRDKYGFKIIVDNDDHWQLGKDHVLYDIYQQTRATDVIAAYIEVADAVTVTHERLKAEAEKINPNCYVLPNAIPEFGQFLYKKTPSDTVRLFWAGGITHANDLEILRNPVKRLSTLPVKMVFGGYGSDPICKRMASAFTNGGKAKNMLIEALPVAHYYGMYSECDVALIPLVDNRFNSFKSNLKILEAAHNGSPVVVSRVHPYLDFPEEIVNYVDKASDWYDKVKELLCPKKRELQGAVLKAYCKTHFNFSKINEQRKQIFNETVQSGKVRKIQEPVSDVG